MGNDFELEFNIMMIFKHLTQIEFSWKFEGESKYSERAN